MTSFHTIAIPHDDILEGRLTMDVFAADLWEVHAGRGAAEYRDPDVFFQKTHVTEGLENLLDLVGRRLRGEGGDPVVQIQTPFGGGKTHALIAMYHKSKEWGANSVVIVGTPLSARQTLWGLLEEQLTGNSERFASLDSPGRDEIRALLEKHQPVLVLMDEVLEYMTKAAAVRVEESTLAAQTLAFMQELTEAASTLDRVSLVVTLPSSILEHFDERAEELFQKLQRVAGRVEKIYTPVQEHEITSVVRRRLFAQVSEKKAAKVIAEFMEYAQREGLLPAGVEPAEYRRRLEAAYPFLPEVVDTLYHRWGSFPTFQRTRGVLRLLALVVYALKDHSLPYISLADFDLEDQEIRRELLKHIGPELDSVIGSDITGPESAARKAGAALGKSYQGLRLGERAATAIFMYSFSGGPERGANLGEVKRSAAVLETPSAVIAEAVESLMNQAFYLQGQGGRYFFTNQPNLNRLLVTRMEGIEPGDLEELELSLLKEQLRGSRLKTLLWPEQPSEIADSSDLKLVILKRAEESEMGRFGLEKGETPRVNRNTLLFLAAVEGERAGFEALARRNLAYHALEQDPTISLTEEQRQQVKDGIKRTDGDVDDALRRMYRAVYVPVRKGLKQVDLGIPTFGEKKGIDDEVYERLRSEGEILERFAPAVIKERFLKDRDWVSTQQLYRATLTTPGELRAVSEEVWRQSIAEGVRLGVFGLGEVDGEDPRCRSWKEGTGVSLAEGEVIIREEICEDQLVSEGMEARASPTPGAAVDDPGEGKGDSSGAEGTMPVGRQRLRLSFSVPKGKVSSIMGVLNFLQSRFDRMDISLSVEDGTITDRDLEDKVRETFRQLGVNAEEED